MLLLPLSFTTFCCGADELDAIFSVTESTFDTILLNLVCRFQLFIPPSNDSTGRLIGVNLDKLFKEFIYILLTLNFKHEDGRKSIIVYAHNLSGFDGNFIMKHLIKYGEVKPLIHNGKLISIKLRFNIKGHKGKTIIFKDSLLMLPLSLRDLGKSFKVEVSKGYFPYLLNDINYKGQFPEYNLFTNISLTEYIDLKNKNLNKIWNFKDEAIKYCIQDSVSLHEILTKFSVLIFNKFKVDPIKLLTLPALAMKIWKTYYIEDSVYQINDLPEHNIRQSYSGGAVDVYIPKNENNEKLYYYDVNSLYPAVMLKNPMPVGRPIAFTGDILKSDSNAFGFFYCKITSPLDLKHPILQRRIKTEQGIRTIAGLGSWEGWIFSEEMYNAVDFGYKFEVIKGYEFKKGYIFKEYINEMYNLRLQYPKGEAMNLIAKLLMNSLYGKFGMRLESTEIFIHDTSTEEGELKLRKDIDTLIS